MAVTNDVKVNKGPVTVPLTPFCGELRSKKFYMMDRMPTEESHYLDSTRHCWCYHTQQPIGPDGDHVGPDLCTPGRKCYRSALADPI